MSTKPVFAKVSVTGLKGAVFGCKKLQHTQTKSSIQFGKVGVSETAVWSFFYLIP